MTDKIPLLSQNNNLTKQNIIIEREQSRDIGVPNKNFMRDPAILMFTFDRPNYLTKTVESLVNVPGFTFSFFLLGAEITNL